MIVKKEQCMQTTIRLAVIYGSTRPGWPEGTTAPIPM